MDSFVRSLAFRAPRADPFRNAPEHANQRLYCHAGADDNALDSLAVLEELAGGDPPYEEKPAAP